MLPDGQWSTAVAVTGSLYRTSGTGYDQPYDASRLIVTPAGTARIEFGSGGTATATFVVDGRSVVKSIRRQAF